MPIKYFIAALCGDPDVAGMDRAFPVLRVVHLERIEEWRCEILRRESGGVRAPLPEPFVP